MDFSTLTAFETGSVELLEFSWPPPAEEQLPQTCLAYVIMKRPSGFLLCVPDGFLSPTELEQGQQAGEEEGIGPSTGISAPPVQLSPFGRLDFPSRLGACVGHDRGLRCPPGRAAEPGRSECGGPGVFSPVRPFRFPPGLGGPQAGEGMVAGRWHPACRQVGLPDRGFSSRAGSCDPRKSPQAEATDYGSARDPAGKDDGGGCGRGGPLGFDSGPRGQAASAGAAACPSTCGAAPRAQPAVGSGRAASLPVGPKELGCSPGSPPLDKATATPLQVDLEEKGQQGLVTGEPIGSTQEGSLASAVLAQSQALVALVSQLSSSSDPLLEVPTGQASVRGAAGRAKLQQDLASRSGGFAQKVRDNMARRMDPTGLLPEDQVSFLRYLERHGGYAGQPLLGLVAWQVAQALDLTAIGATEGAKDSLSLLLLMLDQTAHDKGSSSLGWLLTLQADPPSNLFAPQPSVPGSNLQSFSPLAEQRWITTALAYAKELETISSRIAEGQPKAPQPRPPPKSPAIPQATAADEEQQLSKKQLRAAQWAARKAAAAQNPKKG